MIKLKMGDMATFRWDMVSNIFVPPGPSDPELLNVRGLVISDKKDSDGNLPCVIHDTDSEMAGCGWVIEQGDIEEYNIDPKYLGWCFKWIPASYAILKIQSYSTGDFIKVNTRWSDKGSLIWGIKKPDDKGPEISPHDYKVVGRAFRRDRWDYDYMIVFGEKMSALGWPLDTKDQSEFEVENKYFGTFGIYVEGRYIVGPGKAPSCGGLSCSNPSCRTFCPWVDEPNFPNNIFLCYGCRTNPITKSLMIPEEE